MNIASYIESNSLCRWIVRLDKADSAFVYFILESNEGICFFSTLDHEKGQAYRDLEINCTPEFEGQVQNLFDHLAKNNIEIEFLVSEKVDDKQ